MADALRSRDDGRLLGLCTRPVAALQSPRSADGRRRREVSLGRSLGRRVDGLRQRRAHARKPLGLRRVSRPRPRRRDREHRRLAGVGEPDRRSCARAAEESRRREPRLRAASDGHGPRAGSVSRPCNGGWAIRSGRPDSRPDSPRFHAAASFRAISPQRCRTYWGAESPGRRSC